MKKRTIVLRITAFLLCAAALLWGLTVLLKDRRVTFDYDITRKVEGFYAEEKDSLDFVFVGSSQMFTSVVPTVLWEEYGMTSYDFGASEQPIYLSYYYIKEALRYQKPKAIVLEISYCKLPDYVHEGVHRINLDDLRMGPVKLEAIFDLIPAQERFSYVFELAKYHDTWTQLDKTAMKSLTADKHNPYKGYTPSLEGEPDGGEFIEELAQMTEQKDLPALPVEYLEKIIALTKEAGVDLLFFKTPNNSVENEPYYRAVGALAEQYDIPYLNLNAQMAGQFHNHVFHAETVTKRIGEWLSSLYEIEDKRENAEYAQWNEDAKYYRRYRELLEIDAEEELDGYIRRLTGKDYVVCMAVNEDAGTGLTAETMELLRGLGVTVDLTQAAGQSYIGVFEGGTVHGEAVGSTVQAYDQRLYGHRVSILSQGAQAGNHASITFDGEEYAKDQKGLNIVVYDPLQDLVLSSRCFALTE